MNSARGLTALALILSLIACALAGVSWWKTQSYVSELRGNEQSPGGEGKKPMTGRTADGWLQGNADDRFNQVEKQLRGLDKTMVEVGYRFSELYFGGKDRNWEYAKYQAEKIDLAIRLGLERRPKRAQSAQFFLREEIPAVLEAIKSGNDGIFQEGMDRFRASCMKCHTLENVPYFTVEFPEHRLSPVHNVQ